jgi:hypothetical protein
MYLFLLWTILAVGFDVDFWWWLFWAIVIVANS